MTNGDFIRSMTDEDITENVAKTASIAFIASRTG